MRITKPLKLGLFHRTYSIADSHRFVVKPVVFFDLLNPQTVIPETEGWRRLMSVMPQQQAFDEAMPKASAEMLVLADAYSPDGVPVTELAASIAVGDTAKTLKIIGNRIWLKKWLRRKPSKPVPFTNMPITWERAFGHPGLNENPVGQGGLSQGASGETLVALPNIEYPDAPLSSPRQTVPPAGFGPLSPLWAPRTNSNALFDQTYADRVFPALPADLDFARFNMAPEDQRLSTLTGQEKFSLTNLHAQQPHIEGQLPQYAPRVFVQSGADFVEMGMTPETVWLMPSVNIGALIFCGEQEVGQRYAQLEVDNLMLAYESVGGAQRDVEDYQQILVQRTDPKTGLSHALDESQLSPLPSAALQAQHKQEHAAEVARVNAVRTRAWQTQKAAVEAQHDVTVPEDSAPKPIDPRLVVAPEAVARRDYSMLPSIDYAQEQQAAATEQIAQARAAAPDSAPQGTMSPEQIQQLALSRTRDEQYAAQQLPENFAQDRSDAPSREEINRLELSGLAAALSPKPISFLKAQDAGAVLREAVMEIMHSRGSLAFRDFTGADLSALDFSNQDCQGSIFECANLSTCSFQGANLTGASFVGAQLSGCNFAKAELARSNFSAAKGTNVSFVGANMTDQVMMYGSELTSADFTGAAVSKWVVVNSKLQGAEFAESNIQRLTCMNSNLNASTVSQCSIDASLFADCNLRYTHWSNVTAHRWVILNSHLQLSHMENSSLQRCQIAGDTWVTAATFSASNFTNSGLRSLVGTGVSFQSTKFRQADLGMANFPAGNFSSVVMTDCLANESNYSLSNFSDALLTKTTFGGSSFAGADLTKTDFYQSDVLLADFDNANIADAKNVLRTKLDRLAHAS